MVPPPPSYIMYRRAARGAARVVRRAGAYVAGAAAATATRYGKKAARRYVKTRKTKTSSVRSSLGRKMMQPVVRRTYVSEAAGTGNELTRVKRTVGRYPQLTNNRLMKLMRAGMTDVILRAQGLTNFDTNVGYYPLANRQETEGLNIVPIHVWDLTTFPNNTTSVQAGYAYGWNNLTAGATLVRPSLSVQTPAGAKENSGFYQVEKSSGDMKQGVLSQASKIMHDWSDIRLNLYGARKRGTTFYIDVVRCKDEFSNLVFGGTGNNDLMELIRTMQSPLIYSNLQSYNPHNLKKLQIIKSFKYYVPGGSLDDLDTIGKVKEFKLFLRQGNVYNYAWQQTGAPGLPHEQSDGVDYTNNDGVYNSPFHGSRVFLVIRAFSPERRTQAAAAWNSVDPVKGITEVPADPLTEPSYDLIVRNKFTLPT